MYLVMSHQHKYIYMYIQSSEEQVSFQSVLFHLRFPEHFSGKSLLPASLRLPHSAQWHDFCAYFVSVLTRKMLHLADVALWLDELFAFLIHSNQQLQSSSSASDSFYQLSLWSKGQHPPCHDGRLSGGRLLSEAHQYAGALYFLVTLLYPLAKRRGIYIFTFGIYIAAPKLAVPIFIWVVSKVVEFLQYMSKFSFMSNVW